MRLKEHKSFFLKIYGTDENELNYQIGRFQSLLEKYLGRFEEKKLNLFSAPGRIELGGNHTDHNHGKILAASINLDSIAIASPIQTNRITVLSEGYTESFSIDLNNLNVIQDERETTSALIRGIAYRFQNLGFKIGGFNAVIMSDVLPGSGLSSSASIEVLIGIIFSTLFNGSSIQPEKIAAIGQFAENVYFGKPCGLMDQMACANGGIISIDFKNPQHLTTTEISFDFSNLDYNILVVNTGGNHTDLTSDYAAVPAEMKSVAEKLGGSYCRDISLEKLLSEIQTLRKEVGDRAILRALHFLQENERVDGQINALQQNDFAAFLALIKASGDSSFKWLQNIYSPKNVTEQGVSLALALTEGYLHEIGEGACRVHGGGFAGTIQVFMPKNKTESYTRLIERVFSEGCVKKLTIRESGATHICKFLA